MEEPVEDAGKGEESKGTPRCEHDKDEEFGVELSVVDDVTEGFEDENVFAQEQENECSANPW